MLRRARAARALTLAVALAALPAGAQRAPCESHDDDAIARLTRDVNFLASDDLAGREPGTDGIARAARYITDRLASLGVEPAGAQGWEAPFAIDYGVESTDATLLRARVGEVTREIRTGADLRVAHVNPGACDGTAVGALVYAGHGLDAPAAHWSDFQRGSVRGRIVVVLAGPPMPTDSARRDALARARIVGSLDGKVRAAVARGAVGVIEVSLDAREPMETFTPANAPTGIPVVRVSRAVGAWLLQRPVTSLTPETEPARPTRIPGATARLVTATRPRRITAHNLLGVVRARESDDAGVRAPPLVVGAHYDHVGHGNAGSLTPGVYAIYNGADDNASGTAAVLDLARRLAQRPASRDVVFAWFSAEEEGLLGSHALLEHRPPALREVTAMVNLDMVGRLRGCRLYVESRETAPAFASLVGAVNEPFHFDARPWPIEQGSWGASDHMSFTAARIPALFLFTGLHDDYHRPHDDPPTLNVPGLAGVTAWAEALVRALADTARRAPASLRFAP